MTAPLCEVCGRVQGQTRGPVGLCWAWTNEGRDLAACYRLGYERVITSVAAGKAREQALAAKFDALAKSESNKARSDLAAAEDDVAYLFACLGIAVAWGRRWKMYAARKRWMARGFKAQRDALRALGSTGLAPPHPPEET